MDHRATDGRDEAAPGATLAMQRQAYDRDGPPPLDQRLAALAALDRLLRANATRLARGDLRRFRQPRHRGNHAGAKLVPVLAAIRNARAQPAPLDAAGAAAGRTSLPARPRLGRVAAARLRRDHRALELPAAAHGQPAGGRAGRRQPGDRQAVRTGAALLRPVRPLDRRGDRPGAVTSSPAARRWRRRCAPCRWTTCCSPAPPPSAAWSRAPRPRR